MHIAVLSFPYPSHIYRTLGVVEALAQRGHRVTYPVPARLAPLVERAQAEAIVFETTAEPEPSSAQLPADEAGARELFFGLTTEMFSQLEPAYRRSRPDFLLYRVGCWTGPLLAVKWGVPAARISGTRIARHERQSSGPPEGRIDRSFVERFARFAKGVGVIADPIELLDRRDFCVVTIPRSFQAGGEELGSGYSFVGPCIGVGREDGDWKPPDERPVLLISRGSIFTDRVDFYNVCLRAFSDTKWTVVMATGRHVQRSDLDRVPSNFIVMPWVPQLAILASAGLFISHCGMGSLMEAMSYGVPVVGIPEAADQFDNAARLEELGLGAWLNLRGLTPETLRDAAERVSEDRTIAQRCTAMAADIRAAGGSSAAADSLEREFARLRER